MPELHPDPTLLLDHACGRLPRHLRPLVEAHADLCPECRAALGELSVPGGELLTEAPDEAPPPALWSRLEAALEAERRRVSRLPSGAPIPPAALAELPARVQASWGGLFARGARFFVLDRDERRDSILGLAFMPGGRRFPRHTHHGFEHAVVLAGGYEDESGSYDVGDFAAYAPESDHGPSTLEGEACWILFTIEKPVRFHGWRGFLQRVAGG